MNSGKYLFSQLVEFLPKRVFDGIVKKYSGDIKLSNVAYANANRDYRIFEEFAYYMINLAQSKRLDREFVLHGKFYAFDSTTIDLCLSLFQWAFFRKQRYALELKRTFTFLTNNFVLKASDIALLYKQRWQVELFFRWIKQHLRVTSFWGNTENAVRIQIYVAVITYCLVAIVEHDCELKRTTFNVLRVVSRVLTDKTPIRDLFNGPEKLPDVCDQPVQLEFAFKY